MNLHFPQSAGKSEGFGTTWLYRLYSLSLHAQVFASGEVLAKRMFMVP